MALARVTTHTTAADGTFSVTGATEWNRSHTNAVAGADVGGIPYCPTATSEVTSANFTFASNIVTVGDTATSTSTGVKTGATGSSGIGFICAANRTPGVGEGINFEGGQTKIYSTSAVLLQGGSGNIYCQIGIGGNSKDVQWNGVTTWSKNAPTIGSGFGTSPSIVANNGTFAFTVNVGTGGTASAGVITLPATSTGWAAKIENLTAVAANRADQRTVITATTTTTITVQNQKVSDGTALAWTASDVLQIMAIGY